MRFFIKAVPLLLIVPLPGMIFPILALYACTQRRTVWGFLFASLTQACVIFTAGITLFPFVMPSGAHPLSSLTVWDSTSSQMTLSIMLVIVLIFLPIVLLYTVWSYYKMLGRINVETIRRHNHELYQEDCTMWYLFWFVGILLMCALSTLALVWLESRQK